MNLCRRAVVLALPLVALSAGSAVAVAQGELERDRFRPPPGGPPRLDLAFWVGASFSTDWSQQVVLETHDPSGARTTRLLMPEIGMAPGRTLGGAVTYWRGPLGVRFQGAFTRACLTAGETRCDASPEPETPIRFVTDVDVWTYGVQGVVGLTRDAVARVIRPYLLIGASGVTFDPEEPVPGPGVPEEQSTPPTGGGDIIVVDGTTTLVLTIDRLRFETRFAPEIGAGLDLRLPLGPHGIGVRLELVDQLMSSPVGVRITHIDGGLRGGAFEVDIERPLVHTLRATLGAIIDVGLPAPPPRTVWATEP
ncbi:MAG: hypothetical protein KY466_04175 [Gemmatimonadetes bacterium]|nr:hypothetical protein [Gemmatimonadota bacterium]